MPAVDVPDEPAPLLEKLMLMRRMFLTLAAAGLACGVALAAAPPSSNPLLNEWKGPYGGVPPFDQIKVEQFRPALLAAMQRNLEEINAIANRTDPPTFDNTIVELERSGRALQRVQAIYGVWTGSLSNKTMQAVETEMEPLLSAHNDKITQNAKLYARIEAVYNSPTLSSLTPEQQRLVWLYWKNFTFRGAKLSPADKAKLADLNQKLAGLYTKFRANQLFDEETDFTLDKASDLAGCPQSLVDAAAAEAADKGKKGEWMIANTRSSMEPFLTYATNRELREKAFLMWTSRGDHPGVHDNNPIIPQILALRAQKAKLLGYPTYAHWKLADVMAKTPDAAMALTMKVWTPAVAQVHQDVADMQAIVDGEKGGFKIEPWDYRFYAEKVRKAKYDLDMNEVKPYLQLEKVREAMFWMAGQLYGLTFTPVTDVPTFHPDVRVYEVKDAAGAHVGVWYFDPYARAGKRSGAWMDAYRDQETMDQKIATIVSNNANFIQAAPGQPVLISWTDAETMFHEFGHALHGLNSNVKYPSLSGTNVARDFVEFPSQVHEHWLRSPEVLNRFLVNAQGQPMPPELVAKLNRAATFNSGFSTVETLASTIVDMKIHLAGDQPIDAKKFEETTLAEIGMPHEIVMRHRLPQFGHIFAGEAYAAGYYSYLWAEVLDQDAFEAFTETGNQYDPATAKRFHDDIMSVGNTVDPAVAFHNFRGRDPSVDALLRDHGFPVPKP
jgi:peptidyl-dipeptidase Dcp